jgi:hypothetical protein
MSETGTRIIVAIEPVKLRFVARVPQGSTFDVNRLADAADGLLGNPVVRRWQRYGRRARKRNQRGKRLQPAEDRPDRNHGLESSMVGTWTRLPANTRA